jgi:IS4 transposase
VLEKYSEAKVITSPKGKAMLMDLLPIPEERIVTVADGETLPLGGKTLRFNPGSIVAMDRAYNNYKLFGDWTDRGVYFVTRMKDNALFEVIEERPLPQRRNIVSDQIIRLTGVDAESKCPHPLRRVIVWDKQHSREIVLLTNHLHFGATTISSIYKDRWEIELFFKALKQTLKVKTFVGTSENALLIQIWTALTAMLILKWLHHLSEAGWSLSNMASMLRMNLFTYRDLLQWLHEPFGTPPILPSAQQLSLSFSQIGQPTIGQRG